MNDYIIVDHLASFHYVIAIVVDGSSVLAGVGVPAILFMLILSAIMLIW